MAESLALRAEVISIGDELTSGQRLDTNSQWLSLRLAELGIQTICHTTVADDLQICADAFRLAAQRADIVVCSGGLGPTLDDLTRQAMADAFQAPLELDADSLEKIEQMFAQRQRPMPENNRLQAMFPSGSRVIPNPHGSAPGIDLSVATSQRPSRVFALPGVPAELKQMWLESVAPRIEESLRDGTDRSLDRWRYRAIKLFGIGESDVEVKLPTLIEPQTRADSGDHREPRDHHSADCGAHRERRTVQRVNWPHSARNRARAGGFDFWSPRR